MGKMEKVKVIFRTDKDGNIFCLMPELPAKSGYILCFCYEGEGVFGTCIGGHMEIGTYEAIHDLRLATEKEYSKAFEALKRIYDDCELVVRKKINYGDLCNKAWKREA